MKDLSDSTEMAQNEDDTLADLSFRFERIKETRGGGGKEVNFIFNYAFRHYYSIRNVTSLPRRSLIQI